MSKCLSILGDDDGTLLCGSPKFTLVLDYGKGFNLDGVWAFTGSASPKDGFAIAEGLEALTRRRKMGFMLAILL